MVTVGATAEVCVLAGAGPVFGGLGVLPSPATHAILLQLKAGETARV